MIGCDYTAKNFMDDGLTFRNRIKKGLLTIHPEPVQ